MPELPPVAMGDPGPEDATWGSTEPEWFRLLRGLFCALPGFAWWVAMGFMVRCVGESGWETGDGAFAKTELGDTAWGPADAGGLGQKLPRWFLCMH